MMTGGESTARTSSSSEEDRSTTVTTISSSTASFFKKRRVKKSPFVWVICTLVLLGAGSVLIVGLFQWASNVGSSRNWDVEEMAKRHPALLKKVRALLQTANRSISDEESRQVLRNLSKEHQDTCMSPNCIHTSLSLLESMNFSVDPCHDFYEFVCGSWTHNHQQNSNASSHPLIVNSDQFSKINEKVVKVTQKILENETDNDESDRVLSYARRFYSQCKDLGKLEEEGLNPLWNLMDSYGGWPILLSREPDSKVIKWNGTFDWMTLVADLQRLSCSSVLGLEVKQHPIHAEMNTVYIVQPKLFISREYLINPTKHHRILSAYKSFIVSLAGELIIHGWGRGVQGLHEPQVDWDALYAHAGDIVAFESNLAKALTDEGEPGRVMRKAQYTIQRLQRESVLLTPKAPKFPTQINWVQFLAGVFVDSGLVFTPEEDKVIVTDVAFVRALPSLLASTPPGVLANYLVWRLLVTFTTGTTVRLRKFNFNFYNVVYGMKRIPPRSSTCATVVKDVFALAIGTKIVEDIVDLSSKAEVEGIVDKVRSAMELLMNKKDFFNQNLSSSTSFPISGIGKKLGSLKHCIGYPASLRNSSAIEHFYQDFRFEGKSGEEEGRESGEETYLRKYIRLRYWLYNKTLVTLRHPFDSDCWSGTSWANIGEAYAYYDTARNSINFPIGLLQAPFYWHNVPLSVNYGAIGTIIGHEISHSINVEGWIKIGLVKKLEEYWDCLERHYSNYIVPALGSDTRVNGLRTRSENLADHLGLAAAYLSYKNIMASSNSPKADFRSLVGLELFSQNQLFFISFAHMWCVDGPDEWLADELESSTHTPGIYRVLGTLQNSHEFASAWQCPLGSGMNPVEACNSLLSFY